MVASVTLDARYDDEEPLAVYDSFCPSGWRWEVYEVSGRNVEALVDFYDGHGPFIERTSLFFGRVRSPESEGRWEYGFFTAWAIRRANASRIDVEDQSEEPWP